MYLKGKILKMAQTNIQKVVKTFQLREMLKLFLLFCYCFLNTKSNCYFFCRKKTNGKFQQKEMKNGAKKCPVQIQMCKNKVSA
jgi:hypothetical protein